MKPITYLSALTALTFLFACNQNKKQADTQVTLPKGMAFGKHNYTAHFDKDSARLNFDIAPGGKVSGHLYIYYGDIQPLATKAEIDTGHFEGVFKGDTLIADYVLNSNINPGDRFTNPIAMLAKHDTLWMGSGRIMQYLGRNYFDPKTPIDFSMSRFRFVPVNAGK